MAQFDVYENLSAHMKEQYPFLLDIQNVLHERLDTRMIVPLTNNVPSAAGLSPAFEVCGKTYTAVVPDMLALPLSLLGKKVDNLESKRSDIIDAIDLLIIGF